MPFRYDPTSLVRYEQMSGENPLVLAAGIRSVAMRLAPSIAPWFSGKYTLNPSAQSSSAGPTLVHHAVFFPSGAAAQVGEATCHHVAERLGGGKILAFDGRCGHVVHPLLVRDEGIGEIQ